MARSSRGAGRGGERQGAPGAQYPNRSDLQQGPRVAPQAPTGLPYGEHQQLIAAQQAVPIGPPPPAAPGAPAQAPGAGPAPGFAHVMAPTQNPDEPVTAGIPSGPGPGPEVLSPMAQGAFQPTVGALLQQLASQPNATQAVKQLAAVASTGRQ